MSTHRSVAPEVGIREQSRGSDAATVYPLLNVVRSTFEKYGQLLIGTGLSILGLAIHARWLTDSSLSAGDWRWIATQRLADWFPWPSVWDPTTGLGQKTFTSINFEPIFAVIGGLARFGVPWDVAEKIFFFWPFAVLTMLGPWLLARRIIGNSPWALFAPLIFAGNTYVLIISRMHLTVGVAEALGCLVLLAVINAIRELSLRWAFTAGLLLVLQSAYELRITYLTVLAGLIFVAMLLIAEPRWEIVRRRVSLALVALVVLAAGEAYWLLPFISYGGNHDLPISAAPWLGFMHLGHGLTGVHPFWTGAQPIDFRTTPLNPIYFLFPALAFVPLIKRKVEIEVLWLATICLIAAFLIKQNMPPLGQIYDWMFAHFPGWNLFREASKLFFLVAIGHAVLVPVALRILLSVPFTKTAGLAGRTTAIAAAGVIVLLSTAGFIPLYMGTLGDATVASPVPASFQALSALLDSNHQYGVVAWLGGPLVWNRGEDHYYSPASATHPLLDLSGEVTHPDPFLQFCQTPDLAYCYLTNGLFPHLLNQASVSYVVAPVGSNVGTLPTGVTREWIGQQLTATLGPMQTVGSGADALGVWQVANGPPLVVTSQSVALVAGTQQVTVPAMPALSALDIPVVYQSDLLGGQHSLDSSQVISVIPGSGGYYQIASQGTYALLVHSTAQHLSIVENGSVQPLQQLALSVKSPGWSAYGPIELRPGLVSMGSRATTGVGPIIDWTPASFALLATGTPDRGALSVAVTAERVSVRQLDGLPLQNWVEIKRAFDNGWKSSQVSDHVIGSGLLNLYQLTGAPRPSEVSFSFDTQAAEQAGIIISLIAVALALAGIAMSRRTLPSFAAKTLSRGTGWSPRLAHDLALAGVVLIGFGAIDEAFAWWGVPSALSGLFSDHSPEASAEFVLFGAILLLMGAVAVKVVGMSIPPRWPWAASQLARLVARYQPAGIQTLGRSIPIHGRVRECLQLIEPAGRLLDVGCSSGWLAAQSHAKGVREYVGLDPSIVETQAVDPTTMFMSGSALDLPFDSGTFDSVCLFDVIEHLPRGTEIRALAEAHRVLRPGGKLYLSTPHASLIHTPLDPNWYVGHRHYRRATVKWLLRLTGFTVERQLVAGGIIECLDYLRLLIYKHLLREPVPDIPEVTRLIDRSHGTDHALGLTMFVVATARKRSTS